MKEDAHRFVPDAPTVETQRLQDPDEREGAVLGAEGGGELIGDGDRRLLRQDDTERRRRRRVRAASDGERGNAQQPDAARLPVRTVHQHEILAADQSAKRLGEGNVVEALGHVALVERYALEAHASLRSHRPQYVIERDVVNASAETAALVVHHWCGGVGLCQVGREGRATEEAGESRSHAPRATHRDPHDATMLRVG